jgi:hypothetical protein
MPPRAACQADRCFVRRFFFLSTKSGNSEELVRLICPRLEAIALQTRVLMAFSALLLVGATVLGFAAKDRPIGGWREKRATSVSSQTVTSSPSQRQAFVNLPLIFESNQGQTDSQVKFLSHGSGYALFLTANEAVLTLQHSALSIQPDKFPLCAWPSTVQMQTHRFWGRTRYPAKAIT